MGVGDLTGVDGPPPALVRSLVDGPSVVSGLDWHDTCTSTNILAAAAAAAGVPEVHLVVTDVQTAGRGRLGRVWEAPPGSSVLCSMVLRPSVAQAQLGLLPLLLGLAIADAAAAFAQPANVALKWPNDVLADGRKCAGILAETAHGGVVAGFGIDVDWGGSPVPAGGTDLRTAGGGQPVDRWRVLAAVVALFGNRYDAWMAAPGAFLPAYRARCATIGSAVVVSDVRGVATGVGDDGLLEVRSDDGVVHRVAAGDVRAP